LSRDTDVVVSEQAPLTRAPNSSKHLNSKIIMRLSGPGTTSSYIIQSHSSRLVPMTQGHIIEIFLNGTHLPAANLLMHAVPRETTRAATELVAMQQQRFLRTDLIHRVPIPLIRTIRDHPLDPITTRSPLHDLLNNAVQHPVRVRLRVIVPAHRTPKAPVIADHACNLDSLE